MTKIMRMRLRTDSNSCFVAPSISPEPSRTSCELDHEGKKYKHYPKIQEEFGSFDDGEGVGEALGKGEMQDGWLSGMSSDVGYG